MTKNELKQQIINIINEQAHKLKDIVDYNVGFRRQELYDKEFELLKGMVFLGKRLTGVDHLVVEIIDYHGFVMPIKYKFMEG